MSNIVETCSEPAKSSSQILKKETYSRCYNVKMQNMLDAAYRILLRFRLEELD